MADYFLSNKAVEDLSEIWNYTYNAWSESQADKYYELLIGFCKKISGNPKIGKNYEEIDNDILGYRGGQHIIFYQVVNLNRIEIVRILHGGMDIRNKVKK